MQRHSLCGSSTISSSSVHPSHCSLVIPQQQHQHSFRQLQRPYSVSCRRHLSPGHIPHASRSSTTGFRCQAGRLAAAHVSAAAAAAAPPGARLSHSTWRCAAAAASSQQHEPGATAPSGPAAAAEAAAPSTAPDSSSSDAGGHPVPPLQVTRHNFHQVLPALQAALSACQFYSFDCEMSGLYPAGMEDYVADDVDDRYFKTAAAADSFLVTQMGLSLFTWAGSHYEARSFNFHLFPSPREEWDLRFSCQASSLAFLAAHGFDFNKMIYEGIPFLPLSLRDKQVKAEADALRAAAAPLNPDDLDDDERCLMQELEESICTWLACTPPPTPPPAAAAAADATPRDTLRLPAPPPQLQKLQRRLLAAGVGTTPNSPSHWQYIVLESPTEVPGSDTLLRRATAAEVKAAAAESQQRAQQLAARAAGFSQVLELLRDSGKPAVGHNLRFDVAFVLAAFVQSPLPRSWSGFRALVGEWFPGGIYDTKYLARSLTGLGVPGSSALLPDTGLGPLFKPFAISAAAQQAMGSSSLSSTAGDTAPHAHSINSANLAEWLQQRTAALEQPQLWTTLPPVQHAPGCEQYAAVAASVVGLQQRQQQQQQQEGGDAGPAAAAAAGGGGAVMCGGGAGAHEAGFDALMTGVVFLGLLRLYEITALSSLSRWMLPTAPPLPPQLSVVHSWANRQYHSRSKDIPYAALQGEEVVPQRPHVVYVTGFKGGRMRWQDIQAKFTKAGLGRPMVSLVKEAAAGGNYTQVKGAYVILQSPKEAAKAVQALRSDKTLTIMTYADYFKSKGFQAARANSSSGSGGGAAPRPLPQTIERGAQVGEVGAGGPPPAAESLRVVQDLREAVAAKKQAQKAKALQQQQEQQQQQQQQEQQQEAEQSEVAAAAADGVRPAAPLPQAAEAAASASSSGSSVSPSDGSSSSSDAALQSAQQRLSALQQLQRPSRTGPLLQRPAVRPAVPPSAGRPGS